MRLNKRISRNIKSSLSFYIVCSILTMLTCILIVASTSTGTTMTEVFDDFFERTNVEDAEIYTAKSISEEEQKKLCEKYDLHIEETIYLDEENDDYTMRVFGNSETINKCEITEGKDIHNDDEILVSQRFAEANDLSIGDTVQVRGKDFKITGYMIRPDYMYVLKSQSDSYFDYDSFGDAVISMEAMKQMDKNSSFYAIDYNKKDNYEFRKELNKEYMILSYVDRSSNARIKTAADEGKKVSDMAFNFAPVLFAIVMAVIGLVLSRKIKDEQKQIGTLSALGYRKKDLVRHYLIYSSIPAVIGSVLGIVLGFVLTGPFSDFYFGDFETLPHKISPNVPSVVVSAVVPFVLFSLVTVYVVRKLLKQDTVKLIHGMVGKNSNKQKNLLRNSKMNFKYKFKIRSIVANPLRTLVVVFGILVASICVIFGFGLLDALENTIEQSKTDVIYEHTYFMKTSVTDVPENAEGVIQASCEGGKNKTAFTIWGIDENSKLNKLDTISGEKAVYGNYYMTEAAAEAFHVSAGDTFEFYDIITAQKKEIKISDITEEKTNVRIYTSRENMKELFGYNPDESSILISNDKLDLDNGDVFTHLSKTKMIDIAKTMVGIFNAMCYVIMFFGVLLGVMVVYLITEMLINENVSNITMLGVLGYRRKEINKLILHMNHILILVGYVLAYPVTLFICKAAFADSVATMGVYIPVTISLKSFILGLIIILVTYFLVLFRLRKKVDKQDIVSSLSDNRE